MISLSQQCLPKDPEKINQCFAVFSVSYVIVCFFAQVNVFIQSILVAHLHLL